MTEWNHTTPAPNFQAWMKEFKEIALENDRTKYPNLILNVALALKLDAEGELKQHDDGTLTLFNYETFVTVKHDAPLYEFVESRKEAA